MKKVALLLSGTEESKIILECAYLIQNSIPTNGFAVAQVQEAPQQRECVPLCHVTPRGAQC